MDYNRNIEAIIAASVSIYNHDFASAENIIACQYPFLPVCKESRSYTPQQMMMQFYRDGFIDRYSGEKLLNPGILRVLSEKIPDVFPYHPHWKTDECHIAYWEYPPTVDHICPIALGGTDSEENWASTSMKNNSMKNTFTPEQLGWHLHPAGRIDEWDGLSKCFVDIVESDPSLLKNARIKTWYNATRACMQCYK